MIQALNENIMVSVSMVTYNHEKYIAKAIESVLAQKVNFKIELVIGEDCSKDNTRAICLKYQKQFPDIINLKTYDANIGMCVNVENNYRACRGKYIALLDGDDYWVDNYKLQKQVDILEKKHSLIGCFTNYSIVDDDGKVLVEKAETRGFTNGYIVGIDEFLDKYKAYPTCTVIFRRDNYDFLPVWFDKAPQPDTVVFSLLHLQGDFIFLDDVTLHYRTNPNSVTKDHSSVKRRLLAWFDIYDKMLEVMPIQYHKYYTKEWAYNELIKIYATDKEIGKLGKLYFKSMAEIKPFSIKKSVKTLRDIFYIIRNN